MCNCYICKRHRAIREAEKAGDVPALMNLIDGLESALEDASTERDYLRAVLRGEWEGSIERLEAALGRARKPKVEA